MTTLTAAPPRAHASDYGELTLGELLTDTWQELHSHSAASCPVCRNHMQLAANAGRCVTCGSELR